MGPDTGPFLPKPDLELCAFIFISPAMKLRRFSTSITACSFMCSALVRSTWENEAGPTGRTTLTTPCLPGLCTPLPLSFTSRQTQYWSASQCQKHKLLSGGAVLTQIANIWQADSSSSSDFCEAPHPCGRFS